MFQHMALLSSKCINNKNLAKATASFKRLLESCTDSQVYTATALQTATALVLPGWVTLDYPALWVTLCALDIWISGRQSVLVSPPEYSTIHLPCKSVAGVWNLSKKMCTWPGGLCGQVLLYQDLTMTITCMF